MDTKTLLTSKKISTSRYLDDIQRKHCCTTLAVIAYEYSVHAGVWPQNSLCMSVQCVSPFVSYVTPNKSDDFTQNSAM